MTEATTDAATSAPRTNPTWLVAMVAGAFGLFYAYAVWNALGNLIAAAPLGLNALGWFLWIFTTVFPVLAFTIAFAVGFRRPPLIFALIMLTGLAVTAVFWLNIVAYSATSSRAFFS